ncbi:chemotaxis response regulator protein-glutamate methylesterase [Aureimonas sp. ME7]|uniref:protein-glutamate methylesterase/protein-glutamine glutaminase n=1 Tax=Aureimonas sp. ME7 TaxID=2744252 RepID=UPI0015F70ADB|nr:chemotaxis response regulator protein-glutamate methylesterase [Aureimonas sp. ME7]
MTPTRVLIVDDSPTMRALVRHALSKDHAIQVVGEASEPHEAREKIKSLDPDVVTLDVEMPGMNGIEFLEKIMRLRPTPVIMVSTLTRPGAEATLAALELGAFDCVAKPTAGGVDTLATLPGLVREAKLARAMIGAGTNRLAGRPVATPRRVRENGPELVGIGSSTGGVEALLQVVAKIPADTPPVMIVQHLPGTFTSSFASRLDNASPAHVVEARSGEVLKPGHIYLAPGGKHLTIRRLGGSLACALDEHDPVQGHRPSVDVLFASIARVFEGRATGAILTGMGRDGAQGLLEMRQRGFHTLAQDEATSLVYGMPRVAWEIGAAEKRVPLSRIADEIFG